MAHGDHFGDYQLDIYRAGLRGVAGLVRRSIRREDLLARTGGGGQAGGGRHLEAPVLRKRLLQRVLGAEPRHVVVGDDHVGPEQVGRGHA